MSGAARAAILYGPERPGPRRSGASVRQAPIITRSRERAMRAELERLRDELDVDFAARLREARAFGEVSNNDDYLQIKEEKEVLSARIASLEAALSSATVVAQETDDSAAVAIGVAVKVKDLDSGAVDEYVLIGDFDPPAPSAASAGSPVGRALLGRVAGDEVEVELPAGRRRRLQIVSSRRPRKTAPSAVAEQRTTS
jgi:transcription elongation factor GreA